MQIVPIFILLYLATSFLSPDQREQAGIGSFQNAYRSIHSSTTTAFTRVVLPDQKTTGTDNGVNTKTSSEISEKQTVDLKRLTSARKRNSLKHKRSTTDHIWYATVSPLIPTPTPTPSHTLNPYFVVKPLGSWLYELRKGLLSSKEPQDGPKNVNESTILNEICHVMASDSIHYTNCDPLDKKETSIETEWIPEDFNGVKWKQVLEGKDAGCFFYLRNGSTPLKIPTRTHDKGAIEMSYLAKHTVGKYCYRGNDKAGARLFYKTLLDFHESMEPYSLTDTNIFYSDTLRIIAKHFFLASATLEVIKKGLNASNVRYWTFKGLVSSCLACFVLYSYLKGKFDDQAISSK